MLFVIIIIDSLLLSYFTLFSVFRNSCRVLLKSLVKWRKTQLKVNLNAHIVKNPFTTLHLRHLKTVTCSKTFHFKRRRHFERIY